MRGTINESKAFEQDASYSKVLTEIADAIGDEGAEAICKQYGGTRLYVPKKIKVGHPLEVLLGLEAALKLASVFGGFEHFDIPLSTKFNRAKRNVEICADHANGVALRILARKYCMTERNISNIVSGKQSVKPSSAKRSEMILAGKAAGMSEHSLAIKHGMTITTIRKITNS
jgi:Mor family transcriptional regulator